MPGATYIMTMTPVYLLTIPGNHSIKISQDKLRSLLGEIETELHSSKVYQQAIATVQKLLGSSAEQAKILLKAVGREAIGLAFQQFAQHQKLTEHPQNIDHTDTDSLSPSVKLAKTSDGSSIKGDNINSSINATQTKVSSTTTVNPFSNSEIDFPGKTLMQWFKPNKTPSKTEIAKETAAEQRLTTMCQIGQQLRQARESQRLSLKQLNIYTHIPIHQMEAIENGNLESLPEDTLVRGFIRVMGNSLGLNGTNLAASLPIPNMATSVIPSWHHSPKTTGRLGLEVRPLHLYFGYTALVAGAVGGLSLISQPADNGRALNPEVMNPPSASTPQSSPKSEVTVKPGLQSSNVGISLRSGIAPPEAF